MRAGSPASSCPVLEAHPPGRSRVGRRRRRAPAGRGLRGRGRGRRGALADPVGVTAHVFAPAAAAFAHQRRRGDVIEELAVVRDDQQRAGELGEQVLEQLERLEVEVVRGLVQHEHVARLGQDARQLQAPPLAAREARDRALDLLGREQEVAQVAAHVPRHAADLDRVAAVADVVEHVAGLVERVVQLVEVRDLEPRAVLDRARVRREPAEQQGDERGLAAAVGPEDADAVAAHQRGGQAAHDRRPARVRERQVLHARDHFAAALGLGQRRAHTAGFLAARAPLVAQRFERAHAALVARAPRLDAAPQPCFFLRELLVEQRRLVGFDAQFVLARGEVGVVAGRVAAQPPAVQVQDARGHVAQERAVVRHEHERPAALQQRFLEVLECGEIEVVGGLVQQQHVGVLHERGGEQHAAARAGRQRLERRVQVEREVVRRLVDARLDLPRALAGRGAAGVVQPLAHRAAHVERHVLLQHRHAHALRAHDLARVRGQLAGEQAQQRGLARAVASEQAEALARLDLQRGAVEQRRAGEGDRDVDESEQRHAGRSLRGWGTKGG